MAIIQSLLASFNTTVTHLYNWILAAHDGVPSHELIQRFRGIGSDESSCAPFVAGVVALSRVLTETCELIVSFSQETRFFHAEYLGDSTLSSMMGRWPLSAMYAPHSPEREKCQRLCNPSSELHSLDEPGRGRGTMKSMIEDNLRSAFSGESQAHMRYLIFSDIAASEGLPNVSRLFEAISFAERIHATNHFKNLSHLTGAFPTLAMAGFGPSTTSDNLAIAIEGEQFDIEQMYPVYKNTAAFQNEKGAERSFEWAWKAEMIHAAMFQKAKQSADSGKDLRLGPVQICEVCGHTVEGDAPERCPVCNAPKDKFRKF